jgi:hypothetical protein
MTDSPRDQQSTVAPPTVDAVLADLVRLRSRRGVSYEAMQKAESLPWVRAVTATMALQGRAEAERLLVSYEFLECVARSTTLLGEDHCKLLAATLNFDRLDSTLDQRERAFMRRVHLGEKPYRAMKQTAYLELAARLVGLSESPCAAPAASGTLTAERQRELHRLAGEHFAALSQIHFELAGGTRDVIHAAIEIERLIPNGMRRFKREGDGEINTLRRIVRLIVERQYVAWAADNLPYRVPRLRPELLLDYIAARGQATRVLRSIEGRVRSAQRYDDVLLEPAAASSLPGAGTAGVVEDVTRSSFLFIFRIAIALEETSNWQLIDDPEEGAAAEAPAPILV